MLQAEETSLWMKASIIAANQLSETRYVHTHALVFWLYFYHVASYRVNHNFILFLSSNPIQWLWCYFLYALILLSWLYFTILHATKYSLILNFDKFYTPHKTVSSRNFFFIFSNQSDWCFHFFVVYGRLKALIRQYGGIDSMPRLKNGSTEKMDKTVLVAALVDVLREINENDYSRVAPILQAESSKGGGKKGFSSASK